MRDATERERRIDLCRRVESLPVWAFALFLVTVAVVVLALFLGFSGYTAPDGGSSGP